MTEKELEKKAIVEVEQSIDGVPPEPRIVHCEAETDWREMILRNVSEHKLHVLARGGDIVVFFDGHGEEIGWRDDGRTGAEWPALIDRESFRTNVVRELELPETTQLGELGPRQLSPLGWTHQGVLLLSPTPTPDQVVRVWVAPKTGRVIQCIFGPLPQAMQEDQS